MKRLLALLPVLILTPAPAFAGPAPDDYVSYHKDVEAPRASIDVISDFYNYDAQQGDEYGSYIEITVRNLHEAGKRKYKQRFVLVTGTGRDKIKIPLRPSGDAVCDGTEANFSYEEDKVSVFLPVACSRSSYQIRTRLIGPDGVIYAGDYSTLWEE